MSKRKNEVPEQDGAERGDDQGEHSERNYYYDDSTGYEVYDPENENAETDTEQS